MPMIVFARLQRYKESEKNMRKLKLLLLAALISGCGNHSATRIGAVLSCGTVAVVGEEPVAFVTYDAISCWSDMSQATPATVYTCTSTDIWKKNPTLNFCQTTCGISAGELVWSDIVAPTAQEKTNTGADGKPCTYTNFYFAPR